MVLDRTEIDALAKDCGLYIVEGRGTIGLAIDHPLLEIYKDIRYDERKDIVVKFREIKGKYEFTHLMPMAEYDIVYDITKQPVKKIRAVVIAGTSGSIWYGINDDKYLAPELIIKAIVENLKLRLDDLMNGGLLSKKKQHMKEIAACGEGFEV